MKKNNFLKSKFSVFITVVAFVLLLIFFNSGGLLTKTRSEVFNFFSPVQKLFYRVGGEGSDYFGALFSLGEIINQNKALEEENLRLQSNLISLQEQARENEVLRRQLGADLPKSLKFILADVVGRCSEVSRQCLLIDKGEEDGIKIGSAATAAGGILVGRVVEVSRNSAKIILLSDATSAVNILTQNGRVSGVLKGDRDAGLIVDMMPQNSQIEVGENVITAGQEGDFPKGLLAGRIEAVVSFDVEAFKQGRVRPAADLKDLETLFVAAE
jgi:rod shape-determining protein MreC